MRRRDLLKSALPAAACAVLAKSLPAQETRANGRAFWLEHLQRVAHPVLDALSRGELKKIMPVECARGQEETRRHTTYLEAAGRLLSGIAPWLEHGPSDGEEGKLRAHYVTLTHQALAVGLDPQSPDALEFGANRQNLVDAAFLALAVLRAPQVLNASLDAKVRSQLADRLRETRRFKPGRNNWMLFSAGVEAALHALGQEWKREPVDDALRAHGQWFVGDGAYGDGPHFHWDYYDSYVKHPFLLAVLDELGSQDAAWSAMIAPERTRATRYAAVQERMIAVDGSYPVIGRSITYRCGAFHALADVSLRGALPEGVAPEQVRCAMAALIARTLGAKGTFDSQGWLRIGLAGDQPSLGETYISTGSLYLCANAFLPLGLRANDRFWSGPDAPWTAQKVWRGEDLAADHAIDT